MKFCCGVTLYYPLKEELGAIRKYREVFDCIYLFDNTDSNERLKNQKYYEDDNKFIYISNNKNEGLSVAYNTMCQKAILNDFDYICLLDQDSVIINNDLIKIINYIKIDTSRDVALYVPEINYKHKKYYMQSENDKDVGAEIEWAISSGSFINLLLYQKTEGFDEKYFIDRLDYDYCFIVRKLGYKIIKIKNAFLYQTLGEQGKGIFKGVSQHSSIRHYYVFRNRLYFYLKKNKYSNLEVIKVRLLSLKHIMKVLIFEKQKCEKLKMMIRGGRDFVENKMGKYNKL